MALTPAAAAPVQKAFTPGNVYPGDSIAEPVTNGGKKLIITLRTGCEYYVNTPYGLFKAETDVNGGVNFRFIGVGVLGFTKNGVVSGVTKQIQQAKDAYGRCRWCHGTKFIEGATPGSKGWPCNEC